MAKPAGPTIDLAGARRIVNELQRELNKSTSRVRKASKRAMNKTLRTGRSDASKQIRGTINLKKKVVDERISTRIRSERFLLGRLVVRDRRIQLTEFMTPASISRQWQRQKAGRAKGVRVKVYKKKPPQLYAGTFLNIGRKSGQWHVLKRDTVDRYPVFIQYGPSITEEFAKALPAFERRADRVLQKNLERALGDVLRGFG